MSRTAVRAIAAALIVAVTTLTGCTAQPGTAAVVDGRRITENELAVTLEQLAPLVGDPSPGALLAALIAAPDMAAAASANGVGVSQEDALALLDCASEAGGLEPRDDWSAGSIAVAQIQLASNALATLPDAAEIAAEANATIAARDVQINPRYGSYDAASGTVVAIERPWIAQE